MAKKLNSISDDGLLDRLSKLLQQSRRVESELVAHIGEVDARRLYAREACPSMFAYCTERLNLSEHQAYLRITVARAARQHPVILEMLADGRLHLTAIAKLAPVLSKANRETLLAPAVGKSKREVEELVAELAPKPDVPTTVRKLPEQREAQTRTSELGPDRRPAKPSLARAFNDARHGLDPGLLGPDRVVTFLHAPPPAPPVSPAPRLVVRPLAPDDDPYGRGGGHSVENLNLMCGAHNNYLAELDYGKEVMVRYRKSGSHLSRASARLFDHLRLDDLRVCYRQPNRTHCLPTRHSRKVE